MRQFKFFNVVAILIVCMSLLMAGCSQQSKTSTDTSDKQIQVASDSNSSSLSAEKTQDKQNQSQELTTKIYFSDENGEKLIPVQRTVDITKQSKYMAVVQELINGPASDSEGINIMPKNTKVLAVNVDSKGIATVDFSKEFKQNFAGGSTGELMLIGSIVNSLTEFDEVKAVKFTIEGKQLAALSGHLDLTEPQTRMEDLF